MKTGDHLTCDIASHDIWIDVEIECSHIQLVITFEIKVSQSIIIETLQYSLAEIVNKVLSTKNLPAQYEESDIHLKKIILDKSTETGGDYKKSIIDTHEKPHRILDLDSSQHIGQVLDYLNRYVMCVLSKRKKSEIEVVPSNTSHSYTINDTFNELACNFPIRFLKVEPKISINNNEVRSNKQILNENMSKQKMCNCSIF